jgi:hypothetical protein
VAIPSELLASPGDSIRQKYTQLLAWIDAQKMISQDDRVTTNQTPNGQFVVMNQRPPSIVTPLQVAQSGTDGFVVREGYVNGRLPVIVNKQGQEEPLVDPDGQPHKPAKLPPDRPILVVAEVTFTDTLALEKVLITTKKPNELLRTGAANYSTGTGKVTGHIPLAFNRSGAFIQFTLHNLQARAYLNEGQRRVIYWPG